MKILIVEDDAEIRRLLVEMLKAKKANCQIIEAKNGLEGFNLVNKVFPEMIITDLAMPEINGMELMKLLEVKGITIPVFIFTGRSEFRCLAEKFKNVMIFEKPKQLSLLIDKVLQTAA